MAEALSRVAGRQPFLVPLVEVLEDRMAVRAAITAAVTTAAEDMAEMAIIITIMAMAAA